SGIDGGAVRALGVVVEGVLDLEWVLRNLLDLAQVAVGDFEVVVVVPEVVVHQVGENGVRGRTAVRGQSVHRSEGFVPADVERRIVRCVVVFASARGCAGGEHQCGGGH